ncbi:hypothetical protein B7P43_G01736 [Cryptotermes secundus]|nr:hypothetical protein B7P43_G01736 [Cryptotermes secundus]
MGKAFDCIHVGPGMAYFPAVSLGFKESIVANFGSTPMRYPVPGFEPIQQAPFRDLAKAEKLIVWLSQLLRLFEYKDEILGQDASQSDESISNQAFLMRLAQMLLHHLAPLLLSPYIIEACFVPLLESLCKVTSVSGLSMNETPDGKKHRLMLFLDMMFAFLEEHELKKSLEGIIVCLLTRFRQVSSSLEYRQQKQSLLLLTCLVQHTRTRHHLLEKILFGVVRFNSFLHVKPVDGSCVADVAHVWWDSNSVDQTVEQNKAAYFVACQKIQEAVASVEALQVELLKILLDNSDGTPMQASSRKIFLRNFREFLHENVLSNPTQRPVTLCCIYRLLVTFQALWECEVGEYPIVIPARTFYDGSVNYYNIDRLGGVLSHLNRTLRVQLMQVLGADHPVITTVELPRSLMRDLDNALVGFLLEGEEKCVSLDAAASLVELLDGVILLYYVEAHRHLSKVSTLCKSMGEYVTALGTVTARLETYKRHSLDMPPEIIQELEKSCCVFRQKLSEQARHMAWVRAVVCSDDKQSQLAWLLRVVLHTVKQASQEGQLFAYVPIFYLHSLIEICAALRTYIHPAAPLENVQGYEDLLIEVSQFLCDHFSDPRIVHTGSKDALIQALASFICSPNTLLSLESVPYTSRMTMVRALLRPYESRAWAQSNWVLVRIWQGCGFAFRYHKSPHLLKKHGPRPLQADSSLISQSIQPCPSYLFQCHVKEVMMSDERVTTAFLNSVLNQLNWAFSEFIGMLQEIQNVSIRPQRVFIESRQLKICATCFDLTLALVRVLEMVASIAPEIFTDVTRSSSEVLLGRLCQVLCQVLNRVSSQTSCFQHVITLDIPDLESVDHFPILTAVVGVLLALLLDDMQEFDVNVSKVPRVTKAVLIEPSFQLESICFVLGDVQKGLILKKVKPFSFYNYSDDVSIAEIENVKKMIQLLSFYQGRLSDAGVISEDEICTICYASPISAIFKPCNHHSCRTCIAHHLMISRACFFCKEPVQFVIGLDDTVLPDLSRLGTQSS